jgi:predicted dehydrogenase
VLSGERLRLGVVGTGTVAQAVHLPLLAKRCDLFELTAVCDISPGTLAAVGDRFGVPPARRYASVRELLADAGVDALAVLTSGSHGSVCDAAVRAGLPVMCEKPLAYTLAEADTLASLEPRLLLGYMKLYDPATQRARELLSERPPPRAVEVTVLHPPAESQLEHVPRTLVDDVPEEVRIALAEETESLLTHALGDAPALLRRLYSWELLGSVVHDLALVRNLVGDPVRCDHVDVWPDDGPRSLSILCTLPGDARLSIRWHYLEQYPAYRETLVVHDERGSVGLSFPSPYLLHAPTELRVVDRDGAGERAVGFRSTVEAFEQELVAFHALAVDGTTPEASVAEGRADIATCQGIVAKLADLRELPIGGEAAPAEVAIR